MNSDHPGLAASCLVCGRRQERGLRCGDFTYYRCNGCGLLSSSPLPTAEQIEGHYRLKFNSGNYETARRFAVQYLKVHRQLANFIRVRRGDRVLDVGCFTGELIAILALRGADVFGLELQQEAVAIASQRLPGRVFQADVFGTSFPAGPYGIVTMMGLIEHVIDPATYLRRAHTLLEPGGKIFLQTPDAGSVVARLTGAHWPPLAPIEHIHLFSRRALAGLLEQVGFSEIRFRCHIKLLPVAYVYEMLSNFGPEWRKLLWPLHVFLGGWTLPFYVGEMMVSAVKRC